MNSLAFNPTRTDSLLQFALASAAVQDEYRDRELGPIHLLKYVYLADLSYAERNDGVTYTGAPWRFHHFGPWAEGVFERIEPAVSNVGGVARRFASKYTDDSVRYGLGRQEAA